MTDIAKGLPFTDALKQQIADTERLLEKAKRESPHLVDLYEGEIERLKFLLEQGSKR